MNVARILEEKGREVATIRPQASLADAVDALAGRRIGALVVNEAEGGPPLGILSERDVVRVLSRQGAAALDVGVADVMTHELQTATEATTVDEAMELMTRGRFRHLPICENGRMVGIVSIGDVVKHRIEAAERESEDLRSYIHAGG